MPSIKSNIEKILKECDKHNALLVCVTKNQTVEKIREAIKAGIKIIGENRVKEAVEKFQKLTEEVPDLQLEKHFIGQIQSNKIKQIVENFDLIQSVYKGKHLIEINKQAEKIGKIMPVLIEINISNEEQKGGIDPHKIMDFLSSSHHLKNLKIVGIMGMAENTEDQDKIRTQFIILKGIFDELQKFYPGTTVETGRDLSLHNDKKRGLSLCNDKKCISFLEYPIHDSYPEISYISMGMTNDYQLALSEGSNTVRVGRGVFN